MLEPTKRASTTTSDGDVVTDGSIRLAYSDRGTGEPLVLIMGLGADRSAWELHVQAYEMRYQCFAVDNRGVGASAKLPGPYSTPQMADEYAALIERLQLGPVRVVGISMGGAIAQELALRHPNLVQRLILVSTWARCDAYTTEVFRHFARARAALSPSDFEALLQLWIWSPRYVNEHLAELVQARDAVTDSSQPLHAFLAQCEACVAHDTMGRLDAMQVPTLITAGDADIFTPLALTEELQAQIPGARLHVFPGAAHAHHWEALDEFNRLTMEWLA